MSNNQASIIPSLKYQNANLAIEWLCKAFGFEKHLIAHSKNNNISHAQLTYGNAMIMIGSTSDDFYGRLFQSPKNLNGLNTQAPYIIVENIDAHYKTALSQGAKIVIEIRDEDYGGRGYTCSDIEGHIWNFGSYNPWHQTK